MDKIQIIDFIEMHNIKYSLVENFKNVLKNNSIDDLDITNKNLSIETENIITELIDQVWISFRTKIKQDGNDIGHYSLKYDLNGELIDEYFTIY